MSRFPVVPYQIHKTDGSNKVIQALPETSIKAVYGLAPKIKKYDELLKMVDKRNIENIVTEKDLANYVTKDDLNKAVKDVKKYVDQRINQINFMRFVEPINDLDVCLGQTNYFVPTIRGSKNAPATTATKNCIAFNGSNANEQFLFDGYNGAVHKRTKDNPTSWVILTN